MYIYNRINLNDKSPAEPKKIAFITLRKFLNMTKSQGGGVIDLFGLRRGQLGDLGLEYWQPKYLRTVDIMIRSH